MLLPAFVAAKKNYGAVLVSCEMAAVKWFFNFTIQAQSFDFLSFTQIWYF